MNPQMLLKRLLSVLAVIVLALGVLGACGDGEGDDDEDEGEEEESSITAVYAPPGDSGQDRYAVPDG